MPFPRLSHFLARLVLQFLSLADRIALTLLSK